MSIFHKLKDEFEQLVQRARGGDQAALDQIADAGQRLLNAGRDVFAANSGYARLEADVADRLNALAAQCGQMQRDSFEALMVEHRSESTRLVQELVAALRELRNAFERANASAKRLGADA